MRLLFRLLRRCRQGDRRGRHFYRNIFLLIHHILKFLSRHVFNISIIRIIITKIIIKRSRWIGKNYITFTYNMTVVIFLNLNPIIPKFGIISLVVSLLVDSGAVGNEILVKYGTCHTTFLIWSDSLCLIRCTGDIHDDRSSVLRCNFLLLFVIRTLTQITREVVEYTI